MSRCRLVKTIFSLLLCICLIAIPFVQRSHALVTTTTVVAILILTVLTAMGITLVIADESKEDFILDKGDSFMQSKGYSGSFPDWIKGQTDLQIGLTVGFLTLAKPVVDRIKEFVDWLIPNAASNTIVNIGSGESVPTSAAIIQGTFTQGSTATYLKFHPTSTIIPAYNISDSFTDGLQTITFSESDFPHWTGYYDETNNFINSSGAFNANNKVAFFRNTTPFVANDGTLFPVGIYLVFYLESSTASSVRVRSCFGNPNGLNNKRAFLSDSFMSGSESNASAIIGDLDDLSDLSNTSVVGSDGTTTIYNTFYVTSGSQALDPTSQDLADIIGALQQALDDINRRLEVIGQTAATAAATTVEPDYSDFDLGNIDLSGLGALLTTRFPFCIPWDFARIFDLFVAEPEAPHWEFNLFGNTSLSSKGIDGTIEVDLGDYPLIGQVSRWFCIIDFCLALCFITKKLVWVA